MNLFCVYTVYLCDNSVKKVLSKMGIWDRIYKEGMVILRREEGGVGGGVGEWVGVWRRVSSNVLHTGKG